jgi:hypothetical protein
LERLLLFVVGNKDGRRHGNAQRPSEEVAKMLSLIFLGLCLASGLAGAWILVITRIEMGESD